MEERFESKMVPGRYFVVRHDGSVQQVQVTRKETAASSAAGALVVAGFICLIAAALASD